MKKKALLFNFSNSNSMVRLFLLHAVYRLKCWSLITDDGDDNESAKKAIGQGSV